MSPGTAWGRSGGRSERARGGQLGLQIAEGVTPALVPMSGAETEESVCGAPDLSEEKTFENTRRTRRTRRFRVISYR
jgi:hypothetical protein